MGRLEGIMMRFNRYKMVIHIQIVYVSVCVCVVVWCVLIFQET